VRFFFAVVRGRRGSAQRSEGIDQRARPTRRRLGPSQIGAARAHRPCDSQDRSGSGGQASNARRPPQHRTEFPVSCAAAGESAGLDLLRPFLDRRWTRWRRGSSWSTTP
jgi:hypothetical protein